MGLALRKDDLPNLIALERSVCKESLRDFIQCAWPVVEPNNRYVHGWHIDVICDHLEAVTNGEISRLLINVPPGMMKSLTCGVFWPAWEWGPKNLPHYRYLTTSYNNAYVTRDSRRMRDLIISDWFRERWDNVELLRTGESSFENSKLGWREGKPIVSLTGGRADRVIIDDPHSTETAESDTERKRTVRIFRESIPTRLKDPERSAIVVIMQRLHEGDVSGEIISNNMGYVHLKLPMEFEPDKRCTTVIGFEDPRTEKDELIFPERFPKEVVERDKAVMGSYATAGQFQQEPSPRGGGSFVEENFRIVRAYNPTWVEKMVRYFDKAGTEGGGARTAGVLMAKLRPGSNPDYNFIVLDVKKGHWSSGKRERIIKQIAELDGKNVEVWVEQEPGSGGKESAESTIKNLAGFIVHADRVTGSKVVRADPYAAQVEINNVAVLDEDWRKEFIEEHTKFPTGKFKDQVDAAAGAFAKLNVAVKRAGVWGSR